MSAGIGDTETHQRILEQYDRDARLYRDFTGKVASLLEDLLAENELRVHTLTSRVKARESLAGKLAKGEGKYTALSDVTDIAGIRITTYLESDVEKVARLVVREFVLDSENSDDKGTLLDPDRFGYLSRHHVVSLNPQRCVLPEYRRFPSLKAEIQTRSILQHAWAEIEHDLGYKSKQEVPRPVRRRFSRLAGLLELADQEFNAIQDDVIWYETEVPRRIQQEPQSVTIDLASLRAFVEGSDLVARLDKAIAEATGKQYNARPVIRDNDVERLQYSWVGTIAQLESALEQHAGEMVNFAREYERRIRSRSDVYYAGYCFFYLGIILVLRVGDVAKVETYLRDTAYVAKWEAREKKAQDLATELLMLYATIRKH